MKTVVNMENAENLKAVKAISKHNNRPLKSLAIKTAVVILFVAYLVSINFSPLYNNTP